MHQQVSSLDGHNGGSQTDYRLHGKTNLLTIGNSKAKGQISNPKHIHNVDDASLSAVAVMYQRQRDYLLNKLAPVSRRTNPNTLCSFGDIKH